MRVSEVRPRETEASWKPSRAEVSSGVTVIGMILSLFVSLLPSSLSFSRGGSTEVIVPVVVVAEPGRRTVTELPTTPSAWSESFRFAEIT